ncbi:MAG: NfeD family protein [Clostridiaceae bacterium]|nr:NfeD family protein [Clostridiaceae bacterium]
MDQLILNPDILLWLILLVAFIVIEAATVSLLTTWFAIGSLFSLVLAFLGAPFYWQIAVFFVVSFVLLIFTKPFVDKKLMAKKEATNADRVIGKTGVVIEEIDNIKGTGQVKVLNQIWSASSEENIKKGEKVIVKDIRGVKLIVEKQN